MKSDETVESCLLFLKKLISVHPLSFWSQKGFKNAFSFDEKTLH